MNQLKDAGNELIEWRFKSIRRFQLRRLSFTEAKKYGEKLLESEKIVAIISFEILDFVS